MRNRGYHTGGLRIFRYFAHQISINTEEKQDRLQSRMGIRAVMQQACDLRLKNINR
jgi:hypothetical protein